MRPFGRLGEGGGIVGTYRLDNVLPLPLSGLMGDDGGFLLHEACTDFFPETRRLKRAS